jgi:hypothetical protein
MRRALSLLLVTTLLAGCGPKAAGSDAMPAGTASAEAPAPGGDALTGPVLEQIGASPYLYLRIKTSRGDVWAAVPETTIENGAVVTVANPMRMTNFESTSLQRTFDEVYFGELGSGSAAMGMASAGAGTNPHAGVSQAEAPVQVGQVEKAAGADARTVAELWAQKGTLEGKPVAIRGVVVKVNNGVMGKNWIHLQDGSGDAAQGTNDITVTSAETTAKGETVTIRGTVRTNKDFGSGYVYQVLVEDAKIVK